ncbi:uncharacterized protein LOC135364709 isoform X2 [Mirounga angustirostris]|uniref:uncharacterized protein LOC135364709 isoform X2 n=1 Tax=Mirounga angustirostris TaxID=9716 RepID=UPI00313DA6B1
MPGFLRHTKEDLMCPSHLKQDSFEKLRSTQHLGKACRLRESSVTSPTPKLFLELLLGRRGARQKGDRRVRCDAGRESRYTGAIGPLRSVELQELRASRGAGPSEAGGLGSVLHRTRSSTSTPSAGLGPGVRPARETGPGCAPAAQLRRGQLRAQPGRDEGRGLRKRARGPGLQPPRPPVKACG